MDGINCGQDAKRPKTRLPLPRCQEQRQGLAHAPCTHHHPEVGRPPRPPSGPTPGPTPCKEPARHSPHSGSKPGNLLLIFVFAPTAAARVPGKPCLNFLSGLGSISTDQRVQDPGQEQFCPESHVITAPQGFWQGKPIPPGVRGYQARLQGLPGTCPKRQMRANKVGAERPPQMSVPEDTITHSLQPSLSHAHIGTHGYPHSRPAKHMGRWPFSCTM